ncbi:MAG TPA: DNA polymerase III subunit alpha [Actinomycetota bacterium]|nr:DNA polymerase III subunit alpha [Actinomycetota bacterium]
MFSHLHVASSYSLRHGVCPPSDLVQRAAELGQPAIALTDRDGLYGAVRFMQACLEHGMSGILGADLAQHPQEPPPAARTPVRGGVWRDPRLPRTVLLACGGRGWSALSRLVSAAHIAGERGNPVVGWDLLEEYVVPGELRVLLGPDSEVGRAIARHRFDLADRLLDRWRQVAGGRVYLEIVDHRTAPRGLGDQRPGPDLSTPMARRMWDYADERRAPAVLTNAVRYIHPRQAATADLLDAIRRLVPLDSRHLDRENSGGFLAASTHMHAVAEQVAGPAAGRLLGVTADLAQECVLDPVADFGIGDIHVPELDVLLSGRPPAESAGPAMTGYSARRHRHAQRREEAVRADVLLRARCEAALPTRFAAREAPAARQRLDDELHVIATLGFAGYFLTVAEVVDLIRAMQVRVAARGSGAGSVVNYLLGISGVDPIRHDLLMERFLSPLRRVLPDIDIDVESARRTDIYRRIVDRFGAHRSACVSMRDTYKVRHAVRDVGAALGFPAGEIDEFAKAFPHIRARDARAAVAELPELRSSIVGKLAERGMLDGFLNLVESLDGLPRHIALHPCGVLLSDSSLLDRTPVEASWMGFPMSQFDKDDVEAVGFLKLDVLGIRMQSAMAHAVTEIRRVEQVGIDLDDLPFDDADTYDLITKAKTLGCFQIESPGQRELIGKFGPRDFNDLIIDISLFRPGPVKSDMITPFLSARHGWREPLHLHPDLEPALRETHGVVVFHEQVLRLVSVMTGCSLAEADEVRRQLGSPDGQIQIRTWFIPAALKKGYDLPVVEKVWEVLRSFGSFGFCKAHAAAFALPTYHSAWLKRHYPAAFLAGVLTHDPGMYPKRLILDEARNCGVAVLPLDVNKSRGEYRVEKVGQDCGIRVSLADVKGISDVEVQQIELAQPFFDLADFWTRTPVSRPVVERLIRAGGFDTMHAITSTRRLGRVTRRDLLLQVADLHRAGGRRRARRAAAGQPDGSGLAQRMAAQSRSPRPLTPGTTQLALPLAEQEQPSGLPEMSTADRVAAEVEILGLDVTRHAISFYEPMFAELGVVRARDLLAHRSQAQVMVAGIKVATQTPPIRSGRRVVFLSLDDSTGPIDLTFFEDAQGPFAHTVFHSWLLLATGVIRRTGRRGISVRATGCWSLPDVHGVWKGGGVAAVRDLLNAPVDMPAGPDRMEDPTEDPGTSDPAVRRVLVHASGFRQSPYADTRPAGSPVKQPPKLWHASPGSAG